MRERVAPRSVSWLWAVAAVLWASSSSLAQQPMEPEPQEPESVYGTMPEAEEADEADTDAGYQYLDEEAVSDAVREVLSRPEFLRLRVEPDEPDDAEIPGWLESFLDWLDGWLGSGGEEESAPESSWLPDLSVLNFLVYAVVAAALLLLVAFILRALVGSSGSKKLSTSGAAETPIVRADRAPGEASPGEYWQRALAFGDAADYRRAIRELLLASMSTIERRGLIRFRRGLTNRDYVYAVRGAPRDAFVVIAQAFELVYFGRREATSETYRACKQAFERAFLQEATT